MWSFGKRGALRSTVTPFLLGGLGPYKSSIGTNLHQYAKGGLMLRNSLDANSRHFSCYVTASNTVNNQWRSNDGELTNQYGISIETRTAWTTYTNDWNLHGQSHTLDFSDIFYYGIAVSPYVNGNIVELRGTSFVEIDPMNSPSMSPTSKLTNKPTKPLSENDDCKSGVMIN
eukprot:scaffold16660_cov35-Cyclotella_meneghiniana.AAC.2